MTISYRGPVSFNRWLFVNPEVSPETVYCLDYNPEARSFEGKPAAPHLRSLLPARILVEITRGSIRRRA